MSVLIHRPGVPEEAFVWTQIASLAVAEAAEKMTRERVWVKWPNDLYLRERKVGGILAEWASLPGGDDGMVIGIGLNVMANPPEASQAICLWDVIPMPTSRVDLVCRILEGLESWCGLVRSRGRSVVRDPWLRRSWILGKEVLVEEGGHSIRGRVEGFLTDGRLQVLTGTDQTITFAAGDVSVIPMEASKGTS